jgi:hypothetical protein
LAIITLKVGSMNFPGRHEQLNASFLHPMQFMVCSVGICKPYFACFAAHTHGLRLCRQVGIEERYTLVASLFVPVAWRDGFDANNSATWRGASIWSFQTGHKYDSQGSYAIFGFKNYPTGSDQASPQTLGDNFKQFWVWNPAGNEATPYVVYVDPDQFPGAAEAQATRATRLVDASISSSSLHLAPAVLYDEWNDLAMVVTRLSEIAWKWD